ncbi:hypothetical protein PC9H_011377 [Pleurotus ostreatus]|uniref:Uncharacterized protein n=1 Tax=Pleurotus ostreatus TaxID=5322 RepID=A0A8H6ZIQ2_PLEOS|nr:uncharacterized protein PC9H_011377 [Pleurotus ostreatus]KAF7420859.1 hypothetical protein PC9H_011377 [Pleurotus ostreatus]KAJ8690308.1 hypothetical protein PTI98_011743 [Pleurotus ostreatus]
MKRAKTATTQQRTWPPSPDNGPLRRKMPEAERTRMQVDEEIKLDAAGQRAKKKLPRPKYRPYAPPDFGCLSPSKNRGTAATSHIVLRDATIERDGNTITRVEACLFGSTSNPLPPEMKERNPHWGSIPGEDATTATTIPFTTSPLPKIAHKNSTLVGNMRDGLKKRLETSKDTSVLIIPFGAGNRFTRDNPRYAEQVATFLQSLEGAGPNKISVAPPSHQFAPPTKAHFAMPFAYIATNIPPRIRDLLVRRQTFAFEIDGKKHAFNATEIPGERPTSWVIANFAGGCITNNLDDMTAALEAIINTLFDNDGIAREINKALAGKGVGGSVLERKAIALSTMSLSFVARKDEHGDDSPVWQLAGRPVHDNLKEHRAWLKAIRRITFELNDMKSIVSTPENVGCVWCKAETHSSETCPFPQLKDWKGPTHVGEGFVKPEPPYRPDNGKKKGKATKRSKKGKENEKGAKPK